MPERLIAPRGRLFNYGCRSGKSKRPDRLIHKLETILQSNPRGAAHACSGNSFRGGVSPRFTRRPKGQSTVEYVLIIAIIVLVVLIAGPWVSSAIRNQFNLVAGAIGSGTTGENFYEPEDIPDPQNGTAFAVYSEDDHSLMFYKRRGLPKVGDMFNYRRVTEVYTGFETDMLSTWSSVPWKSKADSVESVQVVDRGIAPRSMRCWFFRFGKLKKCDLMRLDTSKVESMQSAFALCESLTSLDLSGFDTSNVKNMTTMFASCTSLKSLVISNFDTSKVSQIEAMFQHCESLVSLDLSSFDTSNIDSMQNMFNKCYALKSLDISNFNTSRVKNFCGMFQYCKSLTSLDLSNFDTSSAENMWAMFNSCESLSSLSLPSVDTSNVVNMRGMFTGCFDLKLDCSNWDVSSVTQHSSFNQDAPGVILPKAWR